ncbi:MAG: exodeoxyribonuclease I [Buchnera aphidicola (Floraphis choui)]
MSIILNKNKFTFLFYDYETFGIHPALDKPSQFACIRTDIDFNIIDIPIEYFCYPPIDYLPNPESILITGISPIYTKKYGLNEFEFAKKIYKQFIKPNTCIVGYNNIYFDDEVTRNIFYRNFIDPYEWSWKYGNSRWDILDLLRACYVLRPQGIKWPSNKYNNYPSFKLSDISKSNCINHNQVHNAISDVYATLKITKLLKKKQPKLFNYFFENRKKDKLLRMINIYDIKPMIYISRIFGSLRKNVSLIAPILWNPNNSNILISFDLTKNFESFLKYFSSITIENLDYSKIFKKGIVLVYINRCPILAPVNVISIEDMMCLGIDYLLCKKNLLLIRNNIFLKKKLRIINNSIVKLNSSNIDLQIYDVFFNNLEKKVINDIHQKLSLRCFINKKSFVCSNRIKLLLTRCISRNFPHMLNDMEKVVWKKHCSSVINKKVIQEYIRKVEHLLELNKYNFKNILLLQDLLKYIYNIKNEIRNI